MKKGSVLLYVVIIVVLLEGCIEQEKPEVTPPFNVTIPPAIPTATPTVSPTTATITYPFREEVIKYVADMKKVSPEEVKIIDFQNIGLGEPIGAPGINPRIYHKEEYVAVRLIIANYSSLVMAYKNYSSIIIYANYTASTIEEKNLFDLLTKINLDYGCKPIPIKILIINSSFTFNKNDVYRVNSTDHNRLTIEMNENLYYAKFEVVCEFNRAHAYWPTTVGWVDVQTKQIWVRPIPIA